MNFHSGNHQANGQVKFEYSSKWLTNYCPVSEAGEEQELIERVGYYEEMATAAVF
jgi:hypothetical protein